MASLLYFVLETSAWSLPLDCGDNVYILGLSECYNYGYSNPSSCPNIGPCYSGWGKSCHPVFDGYVHIFAKDETWYQHCVRAQWSPGCLASDPAPCKGSGKVMGQELMPMYSHMRTRRSSWLLVSIWSSRNRCSSLGSESGDTWTLSHSLLSSNYAFKINKYFLKPNRTE